VFISVVANIKHNTHTGQWLTTFKATWHPQRDDVFVVGSMEQSRGVSIPPTLYFAILKFDSQPVC
jgi:hypothetical protein